MSFIFDVKKSSRGFSLIEILVALGITSVLALTIAKLMENSNQSVKQIEARSENINLKGLVQSTLSNPTACSNTISPVITQANMTTLNSSPTAKVVVASVKDKTNTSVYSPILKNMSPLNILSIELTNYNSVAGTAELLIQSNFQKSASIIQMVKPVKVPLSVNINNSAPATPTLVACSTMAIGGEWLLGGNAGTVDGQDYIGTSDNTPLNFRVNSIPSGRVATDGMTSFGYKAGLATSGGAVLNTAIGFEALSSLTNIGRNTAVGYHALKVNTGSDNTAVGYNSMTAAAANGNNSAFGSSSLYMLTSGSANTCVGYMCLPSLTTGSNNTAIGHQALIGNLFSNVTGSDNIGIGTFNAQGLTTGNRNIFIGNGAGASITNGSGNIVIGYQAGGGAPTTDSYKLFIDSIQPSVTPGDPLIGGDFVAREIYLLGKVGIGTKTPGIPTNPATPLDYPVLATAGVTKLHVTGGKTILDQEDWKPLVLQSGWGPCTGSFFDQTPSYFKDSVGMVHLKGCIKRTAALPASGGPALIMPIGYMGSRGAWQGPMIKMLDGAAQPSAVEFCNLQHWPTPTGSVTLWSIGGSGNFNTTTGDACLLTGISWRAEIY